MKHILRCIARMKRDQTGATAIEYGLIMALMTLALVGALSTTGASTQDQWEGVADQVKDASEGAGVS